MTWNVVIRCKTLKCVCVRVCVCVCVNPIGNRC